MKKAKDSGKSFVDRKQTAAITDDEITDAVVEGMPNMASSSHDYLFAVTEKVKSGQPHRQMEEADCSLASFSCMNQCPLFKKTMYLGFSLTQDR